jgi:hypothetical protein
MDVKGLPVSNNIEDRRDFAIDQEDNSRARPWNAVKETGAWPADEEYPYRGKVSPIPVPDAAINNTRIHDIITPFLGGTDFTVFPPEERMKLEAVLEANKDKNFVHRIYNPQLSLPLPDIAPDAYGTHMMSYATDEKGAIAYPEIIFDEKAGKLKRLGRSEAQDHAYKTGEFIRFKTPEEAEWFTKNYKEIWKRK